jgi:predicted short-subunit dehydrogenase-like oxidoreductase (DUF2520 family)
MMLPKTAILGSGKLASALAQRLVAQAWPIQWIVSRNRERGKHLAESFRARFLDVADVQDSWNVELLLLCVPDDQIAPAARMFRKSAEVMIHMSGTVDIHALDHKQAAVLWPLMSFNDGQNIPWAEIPWFWEASQKTTEVLVQTLVKTLGGNAIHASGDARRMMHLAAVCAHNFSNACISMGQELALEAGCSPEALNPMLQNMMNQLLKQPARLLQTGPAMRGDVQSMNAHLNLLQDHPEMAVCYRAISDFIRFQSKKIEKG